MDKVDSLKFFVRLVEKGGIASAGRDFGMSAATASDRLATLETYYGAKLVNRTTRAISLTEEGRLLYDGARDLIEASSDLESRVKFGTSQLSGGIKITAPQDIGHKRISPLIDEFLKENPSVNVELLLNDRNFDIVSDGIDLSVRLGPMNKSSSLRVKKLANNRRIVCASPEYLKIKGTPKHPEELSVHNCLIMYWGQMVDREWTFNVNGRKRTYLIQGNRASNNGLQVKEWCLAGYGIAYKSIWDIKDYLASGELVELLPEFQYNQNSALQLIYPGGREPSKRVLMLINHLVMRFDGMAYEV